MVETYKKLTKYIPLVEVEEFGEWIVDNVNDGSKEHPIQFPFVNYSIIIRELQQDIYLFNDEHPEYGLNNYYEILEQSHISWDSESMLDANIDELEGTTIMALLIAAVRSERFCDGAFLNFLEKGAVYKWLKRLKEIDQNC
ncbi:hypothetical protein A4S06_02265 [Erysipelotrichaceae bacterium MTC7]|nr:hypothetical protein A4S06_02265 [Erysipelotrichaceae bacterium MTC7]